MICSCGHPSKDECHDIFETLLGVVFTDFSYGKTHRLMVDAYALQHPDQYMISAKSYAAHLTGMVITMMYENDPALFRKTQQWLSGDKQLNKPELPESLGEMRLAHVWEAKDGAEHNRFVEEWAGDVWEAYVDYHDLAKGWIEKARQEF